MKVDSCCYLVRSLRSLFNVVRILIINLLQFVNILVLIVSVVSFNLLDWSVGTCTDKHTCLVSHSYKRDI